MRVGSLGRCLPPDPRQKDIVVDGGMVLVSAVAGAPGLTDRHSAWRGRGGRGGTRAVSHLHVPRRPRCVYGGGLGGGISPGSPGGGGGGEEKVGAG